MRRLTYQIQRQKIVRMKKCQSLVNWQSGSSNVTENRLLPWCFTWVNLSQETSSSPSRYILSQITIPSPFPECGQLFSLSGVAITKASTMCFSGEMSAAFAAVGLFATWWIWSKTSNTALASGVFFFFTMELLQAVQYFFIAPNISSPICDTFINKFLTVLGFLHICLQPYFCHVINCSLTKSEKYIDRYLVIKRLCLIGMWIFLSISNFYSFLLRWKYAFCSFLIGWYLGTNSRWYSIYRMVTWS